jgi:hypothetical protein
VTVQQDPPRCSTSYVGIRESSPKCSDYPRVAFLGSDRSAASVPLQARRCAGRENDRPSHRR